MILESIKYMILGMGIVFIFLYVMVLVLDMQHKLVEKYFPQKEEPPQAPSRKDKLKKVAATIAAIHHMKNS
ncbi:OadG family protein [Nitrosophilus kaiyonis]|uniref:OadG family protein n=1 Tax=Nitrosophilus kaiyonis TaxID=2930200 RepID=UPI002490844A|nr:OadG family transporter subunit [Nitrosophilus kaiyonis]